MGTRGIGRAIAERYVGARAKVVVISRNEQECKQIAKHRRVLGSEAIGIAADMGRPDELRPAVGVSRDRAFGTGPSSSKQRGDALRSQGSARTR